jgi:hypothetical protein
MADCPLRLDNRVEPCRQYGQLHVVELAGAEPVDRVAPCAGSHETLHDQQSSSRHEHPLRFGQGRSLVRPVMVRSECPDDCSIVMRGVLEGSDHLCGWQDVSDTP